MTLRRRLALVAAAAVAIAIVLASGIVYVVVRGELRGGVDDELRATASGPGMLRLAMLGERRATGPAGGPPWRGGPHVVEDPVMPPLDALGLQTAYVAIVAADGTVVGGSSVAEAPAGSAGDAAQGTAAPDGGGPGAAGSDDGGPSVAGAGEGDPRMGADGGASTARPAVPVTAATLAVAAGEGGAFFSDARVGDEAVRVYTRPLAEVEGYALQVAQPLTDVDGTLERLLLVLALVSAGGIALAAALGRVVARTALRPVGRLTGTVEHVAQTSDLSRRIDVTGAGEDEIARLARSFNTMLAALEASVGRQRQLVADASHELRTPLTSVRTNIEVLARPDGLPADERRRVLADVVEQLDELGALVGDVVELAREEEPADTVEDVRLDGLVEAAVQRARRRPGAPAFAATLEPCLVRGTPARLDRAVANLLDNAAKWSPPGAEVTVTLRDGELTVRDRGPGIDAADLPNVFERFYRAPSARGMPGSGLGLAIVRQVAELHGGRVTAEAAPGGGALMRLSLPAEAIDDAGDGLVAADAGSADPASDSDVRTRRCAPPGASPPPPPAPAASGAPGAGDGTSTPAG